MLLDSAEPEHLILLSHLNKMLQAFFEFCRAFACSINISEAYPLVRL